MNIWSYFLLLYHLKEIAGRNNGVTIKENSSSIKDGMCCYNIHYQGCALLAKSRMFPIFISDRRIFIRSVVLTRSFWLYRSKEERNRNQFLQHHPDSPRIATVAEKVNGAALITVQTMLNDHVRKITLVLLQLQLHEESALRPRPKQAFIKISIQHD